MSKSLSNKFHFRSIEPEVDCIAASSLVKDVLNGLQQSQKQISQIYFYDDRGSQLFDDICEIPEYYLTKAETQILEQHAADIAKCIGPNALLVEFGSGASKKTRLLLDQLKSDLVAYVPVDISRSHLLEAARRIKTTYPDLEVLPACADFTRPFRLPTPSRHVDRVIVYFPGATIGNFDPVGAVALMQVMRIMATPKLGESRASGALVIGLDMVKDPAILERAYNDEAGVTAKFNKNVLRRLNRDLKANFDLDNFRHQAVWMPATCRIEMRLISTKRQKVAIAGEIISFEANEFIITEHCHKYMPELFTAQATAAGWTTMQTWTDQKQFFQNQYLEVGYPKTG